MKTKLVEIEKLKFGDVVQNLGSGNSYTVTWVTESGRVFATREIEISNPNEWVLVVNDDNEQ